jgi:hypothetical protein
MGCEMGVWIWVGEGERGGGAEGGDLFNGEVDLGVD